MINEPRPRLGLYIIVPRPRLGLYIIV